MSVNQKDAVMQAQHDDKVLSAAQAIFSWRFPRATWSDPLFSGYRDDCLLLVVQFKEMFLRGMQIQPVYLWSIPSGDGIDQRWRQHFVAGKIAEALSELAAGVPIASLDADDRAWVKGQAEQLVEDAVARFDGPVKDDGSNYQPHQEREKDSIDEVRRVG